MKTTTKTSPLLQKLRDRLVKEERHLREQEEYVRSIREQIEEYQQIVDARGW